MQVYGLTKAQAGQILSMIAIGMIVGSPFLSFLSNRIFQGRKPVLVLSSFIVLCLTALLAFHTEGLPIPVLYIICLGLGIFSSAVVVVFGFRIIGSSLIDKCLRILFKVTHQSIEHEIAQLETAEVPGFIGNFERIQEADAEVVCWVGDRIA